MKVTNAHISDIVELKFMDSERMNHMKCITGVLVTMLERGYTHVINVGKHHHKSPTSLHTYRLYTEE